MFAMLQVMCLLACDSDILQSSLLRAPPSGRRVFSLTFEETDPCFVIKVAAVQTETRIEKRTLSSLLALESQPTLCFIITFLSLASPQYQFGYFYTRVGTLIVATIYLQLIQNRYMFQSFTVLHCSHQHCVQPVASDVEVVGYL